MNHMLPGLGQQDGESKEVGSSLDSLVLEKASGKASLEKRLDSLRTELAFSLANYIADRTPQNLDAVLFTLFSSKITSKEYKETLSQNPHRPSEESKKAAKDEILGVHKDTLRSVQIAVVDSIKGEDDAIQSLESKVDRGQESPQNAAQTSEEDDVFKVLRKELEKISENISAHGKYMKRGKIYFAHSKAPHAFELASEVYDVFDDPRMSEWMAYLMTGTLQFKDTFRRAYQLEQENKLWLEKVQADYPFLSSAYEKYKSSPTPVNGLKLFEEYQSLKARFSDDDLKISTDEPTLQALKNIFTDLEKNHLFQTAFTGFVNAFERIASYLGLFSTDQKNTTLSPYAQFHLPRFIKAINLADRSIDHLFADESTQPSSFPNSAAANLFKLSPYQLRDSADRMVEKIDRILSLLERDKDERSPEARSQLSKLLQSARKACLDNIGMIPKWIMTLYEQRLADYHRIPVFLFDARQKAYDACVYSLQQAKDYGIQGDELPQLPKSPESVEKSAIQASVAGMSLFAIGAGLERKLSQDIPLAQSDIQGKAYRGSRLEILHRSAIALSQRNIALGPQLRIIDGLVPKAKSFFERIDQDDNPSTEAIQQVPFTAEEKVFLAELANGTIPGCDDPRYKVLYRLALHFHKLDTPEDFLEQLKSDTGRKTLENTTLNVLDKIIDNFTRIQDCIDQYTAFKSPAHLRELCLSWCNFSIEELYRANTLFVVLQDKRGTVEHHCPKISQKSFCLEAFIQLKQATDSIFLKFHTNLEELVNRHEARAGFVVLDVLNDQTDWIALAPSLRAFEVNPGIVSSFFIESYKELMELSDKASQISTEAFQWNSMVEHRFKVFSHQYNLWRKSPTNIALLCSVVETYNDFFALFTVKDRALLEKKIIGFNPRYLSIAMVDTLHNFEEHFPSMSLALAKADTDDHPLNDIAKALEQTAQAVSSERTYSSKILGDLGNLAIEATQCRDLSIDDKAEQVSLPISDLAKAISYCHQQFPENEIQAGLMRLQGMGNAVRNYLDHNKDRSQKPKLRVQLDKIADGFAAMLKVAQATYRSPEATAGL